MKWVLARLYKLVVDVVTIATSRDRFRALLRVPLYSNALYLMLSHAANAVFGFVFWIIVARFYVPEDVGLASAAISAASLLATLSSLGLGYGLIRFLHSGKNAGNLINSSFTIGGSLSAVVALIYIAGLSLWSPALVFIKQNPVYLVSFVLFAVASTLSLLTDQTVVASRRAGFALAKSLIFNVLRLILPVVLAIFFHSFGIFASWGISLSLTLLVGVFLFLPRAQSGYRPFFAVDRKAVNDMLHFSFANYIGDLFWATPVFILPIMVVNLVAAEANAYFYIAWAVGGILSMIPGATSTSLFAEGSYEVAELWQIAWRSLKAAFLILMPAVILVLAFAPQLLLLFGNTYSENGTTLLRLLAISALPVAINVTYIAIKRVEKKLKVIVGLTAFAGVVTIGLSYLLLPRVGITGAGIAWLISQGVVTLWIAASSLKRRGLLHHLGTILFPRRGD